MLDAKLALCALTLGLFAAPAARQEMEEPTPEHVELLSGVGTWGGTMTLFAPDGSEMASSPARETVEGVGPFWTQARFECELMGQPYVGTGHMGYDPAKGKYVGTWVDSMSSFFALMEGETSADGKTLVMHWTAPDMTGRMSPHRSETVRSKDAYTSTFFMGDDTRTMVLAMKRTSKAAEAAAGK